MTWNVLYILQKLHKNKKNYREKNDENTCIAEYLHIIHKPYITNKSSKENPNNLKQRLEPRSI